MSQFYVYLQLGFEHISDVKGYDHILFIISLCAIYMLTDWKKVAWMVTAFTLGHSVTLALAALKIVLFNPLWIEFLIPLTIFLTCLGNVNRERNSENKIELFRYVLVLFFGFIHGMGFSNFFNALMGDGQSILWPLFAFNLGLEFGQLMIVLVFLGSQWIIAQIYKMDRKTWITFISGGGAGISLLTPNTSIMAAV
ncbi:MAG: HupE/UreJ family protein [Cytophagales bacterium]|nr:HupE/UreJ family protein [Cytophagales bacterium]